MDYRLATSRAPSPMNQAEACKQAQADMERTQKEFRAKADVVAAVKKRKL